MKTDDVNLNPFSARTGILKLSITCDLVMRCGVSRSRLFMSHSTENPRLLIMRYSCAQVVSEMLKRDPGRIRSSLSCDAEHVERGQTPWC